ncbi:hypothetical protein IKG02_00915 [Candidatus Saccharibacteria bacterium]|nr:hypothetical protein [Candidatus Saccharibacteria bacterium]
MKLSDYVSVITLAIAGTILAYFLGNQILGDPLDKTVSFEYIETIGADLVEPDSEVFNSGAINPTVEVYVGSCVDENQDGFIDQAELINCGQATPESAEGEDDTSEDEVIENLNSSSSSTSGGAVTSGTGTSTTNAQR